MVQFVSVRFYKTHFAFKHHDVALSQIFSGGVISQRTAPKKKLQHTQISNTDTDTFQVFKDTSLKVHSMLFVLNMFNVQFLCPLK